MSSKNDTTDIVLMFLSSGWYFLIAGAIIRSIFLCIKRAICGYEEEIIAEEEEETPERYRTMSFARQEEIDNLRETALLRNLNKFTLTLGDEHLLCCSGSQTDTTLSTSTSECNDESVTSDESCTDMERNNDVEEGNNDVVVVHNGGDMAQDSKSAAAGDAAVKYTQHIAAASDTANAAVEYTHISLPLPGCDVTGIDIFNIEATQESGRREEKRDGSCIFCFRLEIEMMMEERHLKLQIPTIQIVSCKVLKCEECPYFVQSVSRNMKRVTGYAGLQMQNAATYFMKTVFCSG